MKGISHNAIDWSGKQVNQLTVVEPDPNQQGYWICNCSCGVQCSVSSMSLKAGQKSCGCIRHNPTHNWENRIGTRHGKLIFLKYLGKSRWLCKCDCGNETEVLTTNLSRTFGCRHCSHRKDITGERIGLLTAIEPEASPTESQPLWLFQCDCGNTVQGTVREFHAQWLRSCGCHDNAHGSWVMMLDRCNNPSNNRYNSYGGRGIHVCNRWNKFSNFIADMRERPKRHNLSRKNCEKNYSPSNCFWEHVSKNCRDTKNDGIPTKPGLRKGAKPR